MGRWDGSRGDGGDWGRCEWGVRVKSGESMKTHGSSWREDHGMLMIGAFLGGAPRMQLRIWERGRQGGRPERLKGVRRLIQGFENEADV